ncbi:MAG TPA: hypothetical protein DD979_13985 [Gammaproteobacteria bacterium]|nr:hypothetical protein [Gammaproteobacteria bacterium]
MWSLLSACASSPISIAERQGFSVSKRVANGFTHAIFRNPVPVAPGGTLSVYLENDGIPWLRGRLVMLDPTPRHPLMLKLMALDPGSAVYVGRPCYNGYADEPACHPVLWTLARYSDTVVAAMTSVIDALYRESGAARLRLYGHSGGGALALLIASRLNDVEAVVTLSGNLDTAAWTAWHQYTPLATSLNPATDAAIAPQVRQVHLLGAKDRNIPPAIVLPWLQSAPERQYYVFDDFDHSCCWEEVWPEVLRHVMADGNESRQEASAYPGYGPLKSWFGFGEPGEKSATKHAAWVTGRGFLR